MKTKPPEPSNTITVSRDGYKELVNLVNDICAYIEEPANWPLFPEDQTHFVRKFCHHARKIKSSEAFVTDQLALALGEYTKFHEVGMQPPAKKRKS